jgi:hypothetical protein
MFTIDPAITKEFAVIYYTANVFLVDARVDFTCHGLGVRAVW